MPNPYLYDKLVQAHAQKLLHEAEQQRMLAQLPQQHPHLLHSVAGHFAAFFMTLSFFAKNVGPSARRVTGEL